MRTLALVIAIFLLSTASTLRAQSPLPPIESVRIDERGRFVVNGKLFFPILLYDARTDDVTLKELAEFGFNVLTVRKPEDSAALPAKGFYGAAHVHARVADASGLLLAIGADSPAMYVKENLIGKTVEQNAKSKELSGRPVMNAIGYWENEPEGVRAGTLYPREKYADLAAAIEVPAPYLYPVPYQPIATVGGAVAVAKKGGGASGGGKPVLPILQLFAWTAEDRYPTPAELRAMAFASLLEGATGIGYYSYGSVTGHKDKTIAEVQPELWRSVQALNAELAKFGPPLAGREEPNVSIGVLDGVRGRAVAVEGGTLVVIVNQTDQPKQVALKLPAGFNAWKNTSSKVTDGRVALGPFEVFTGTVSGF